MTLFIFLLALTTITRLIEMNISRRHRRRLFEEGAAPSPDPGFFGMVLLHGGILAGSLAEVLILHRSAPLWLAVLAAVLVLGASALRVWAIRSLGRHWNVRVVNSTALGVVHRGPYKYIRHPNYVAVFLELAFIPLVQGAWISAMLGTALHLVVLSRRISHEESMLMRSSVYRRKMASKPKFIPDFFDSSKLNRRDSCEGRADRRRGARRQRPRRPIGTARADRRIA